jgi:hypothetical protein
MDFLKEENVAPIVWLIAGCVMTLVLNREKPSLETSDSHSLPLIELILCAIGFTSIGLFFLYEPSWIGANSIPWLWLAVFILVWVVGSTLLGGVSIFAFLGYFLLLSSQLSTDATEPWLQGFANPHSPALPTLSCIALTVVFSGFHAGEQLRSFFDATRSPFSISCITLLLLGAALIGLCSGGVMSFVVRVIGAIV